MPIEHGSSPPVAAVKTPPPSSAGSPGASGRVVAGGHDLGWAVWAVVAAFGTYFCMYAFRKPFTAGTYAGHAAWGIDFKVVLVASQVLGYMVSKFIGIKVVAEVSPSQRSRRICGLIAVAEVALVFFGLVEPPWNALFLFLNGLPLGMVFGLVLGFLEGRRLTEALAAGLCASFILADGVMKSVGAWLLSSGIPEFWMPAVAGGLFLGPLGAGVWMLSRIPPPDRHDVAARADRAPLTRGERQSLLRRYFRGLVPIVAMYLAVTILRSVRADFAPEIWQGLGAMAQPTTFTSSELYVAFGVLLVNGCAVFIGDNRRAFLAALGTCAAGFLLIAAAVVGWKAAWWGGFPFMVLTGLGLYLPYVAVHTTIFERLLAMTRDRGNIGFLLYVADAVGYLGYAAVMLTRATLAIEGNMAQFFASACWLTVIGSLACIGVSWRYFAARAPQAESC